MALNYLRFTRFAFLAMAIAFFIYNIYQAIPATILITHFPLMIERLPSIINSSTNPSLQLTLFVTQEVIGSFDAYIRLISSFFATSFAVLFYRRKPGYINKLSKALLFEAIHFLLYIPVVINHLVGSIISSSTFLNFNTGISYLLQILLVSPILLVLSLRLKKDSKLSSTFPLAIAALSLYLFGLWIKHGFMWFYGVLPMQTQPTIIEVMGSVNSLLTLLLAAIVSSTAYFMAKKNFGNANIKIHLISLSFILAGAFFVIYDVISVFSQIYGAYIFLTETWMVTSFDLWITLLYDNRNQAISKSFPL